MNGFPLLTGEPLKHALEAPRHVPAEACDLETPVRIPLSPHALVRCSFLNMSYEYLKHMASSIHQSVLIFVIIFAHGWRFFYI